MSKYDLAFDLKLFIQSIFKKTCKVIEYENNMYEIYINDDLKCHFQAMNLDQLNFYLTRFKLDYTSGLIA